LPNLQLKDSEIFKKVTHLNSNVYINNLADTRNMKKSGTNRKPIIAKEQPFKRGIGLYGNWQLKKPNLM